MRPATLCPVFPNIMNELKEPQVKRQFLLSNPPVRSSQDLNSDQKPSIVLTWISQNPSPSSSRANSPPSDTRCGGVAPFGQPIVNVIFIGVDNSSFGNRLFDQRGDRLLLHVWEHRDDNLAATLHHAEDRRFLLLQRSSAVFTLQPACPSRPFFLTSSGLPLCPATT